MSHIPDELARFIRGGANKYHLPPLDLLPVVLAVAGAAIGNGAVVETDLLARPVSAGLSVAFCGRPNDARERACEVLLQPLRDLQDENLRSARTSNERRTSAEQVRREQESFFGLDPIRNPEAERAFQRTLATFEAQRSPVLIVDDLRPKMVRRALARSGGHGLVIFFRERTFETLLRDRGHPQIFELAAESFAGRTPNELLLNFGQTPVPVRPVLNCVFLANPAMLASVFCSGDPFFSNFGEQLLVSQLPVLPKPLSFACEGSNSDSWRNLLRRFVQNRHRGESQHLKLAPEASALLAKYTAEIHELGYRQRRLACNAPLLATKIGLILWKCSEDEGRTIPLSTMSNAIQLTRELVRTSEAVALQGAVTQRTAEMDRKALQMLGKLKSIQPAKPRDLFRRYDTSSKMEHEPVLEFLVSTGRVRRRPDGRFETCI